MKNKILIFISAIAFLLLSATTVVAQGTKAYFKKDGVTVFESALSDIDSIVFVQTAKEEGCEFFDNPQGLFLKNIKCIYTNGNYIAIYDPYVAGVKNPLAGQLHTHTTNSDGSYSPAVVAKKFKDAGYDFWTITDHNKITPNPNVNDLIWLCNSYEDTRSTYHANVYNATRVYENNDVNALINYYVHYGNGIIMFNHPDWTKLPISDGQLRAIIKGLSFCEVFNLAGTTSTDRGYDILISNGHLIWAVATDDYHKDTDLKKGWVVTYSESNRADDIMHALLSGSFVATSGFVISNVELIGNKVSINTGDTNAKTTFYKENMTVLATISGKLAEYEIKGDEMFVRAVVQNTAGKKCWVQPYFLLGNGKATN